MHLERPGPGQGGEVGGRRDPPLVDEQPAQDASDQREHEQQPGEGDHDGRREPSLVRRVTHR
jgi:hypothetical protein